ncbi:aminotransferase class V-fold PLP-dependent enzyme [Kitasatospora sp. CB01950]|uniref:aminotransferase class V-fold PLP-dependent enzyme n=1 Tax=Kitasatospora sp. CB01950 TaxID=1703930 RepID=UPI00093BC867|nr:aminotransferase class V-fold PLP-dependent enzyme [Kitasatospora sp. CB01950]OKJ16113.1 aminotransferase class V [Kitasatospora sp. CB01950]
MTTVVAPKPLLLQDGRPAAAGWSLDTSMRHLNHGSFGAVPLAAQRAQQDLREEMERAPVVWFPELPRRVARARAAIAEFLRVPAEFTALVPNASAGASAVYNSLPHRPGGEVLVTDHGYGAVTMGAARLARRWGGTVRTAHVPLAAGPEEAAAAILEQLGDRTALIVLDQITSATARRLPIDLIGPVARERGIPLLVDAAHVPALLEDPRAGLDCDAWVGNLHKFGCAPRGTAALVARGELRHTLYPLIDSWGAEEPFPTRFDTQGTVDATSYLAAPTALDFVADQWGWPEARQYMTELADYAEELIGESFTAATGEPAAAEVGMPVNALRLVRLPAGLGRTRLEADALRDRLATEFGVEAAFTSFGGTGYFRLSTHVYNTAADYEYFAEECVPVVCDWAAKARREA